VLNLKPLKRFPKSGTHC